MYPPFVFQYVHSFHIYMTYAMFSYQSCMSAGDPCMYLSSRDLFKIMWRKKKEKKVIRRGNSSLSLSFSGSGSPPWLHSVFLMQMLSCSTQKGKLKSPLSFHVCGRFCCSVQSSERRSETRLSSPGSLINRTSRCCTMNAENKIK